MNNKVRLIGVGVLFYLGQNLSAQQAKDSLKEKNIEEVVVVAYGKQKKETVVGSNVQIDAKDFEKRSITNISNVIEGAAPGIQVVAGSGQPGAGTTIRIRGFSSINAGNSPLYVVDGVVFNGNIASINPNDIAAVNVLKDAASTSLYGSSAANGVILITTKKGRKGRDVVNFSMNTGVTVRGIPEYDQVNADEYYPLIWQSIRNGYLSSNPTKTLAEGNAYASTNLIPVLKQNIYSNVADNMVVVNGVLAPNAIKKYDDFDWQKDLFKTGFRQNYDLSYSGGTDKTTYFASFGYLNESGYLAQSDYERFTARVSADSQVRDYLKLGINLFGSNTTSNNALDGSNNNSSLVNPYYFTRRMGPIYSPYNHNADGSQVLDANGNPTYDFTSTRGGGAYTGRNAIYENLLNKDLTKGYNVNARVYSEFKFWDDFTFTVNAGYDTRNTYNSTYTNNIVGDAIGSGAATKTTGVVNSVTFNQLLNYKKNLGNHGFDVLVGHENNKYKYEYFYGRRIGQIASDNYDLINFITTTDLTSTTDVYNKEAYFSRFNYNYDEKYLLSGSFRRDASSKFAPDYRWENFYSIGAGWRVNKESFAQNWNWLNELKLRSSYGEVGNDNVLNSDGSINYYAYQDLFSLGYNNGSEPGVVFGTAADESITWESNKQLDFGLEFSILKNRISGSVEYYERKTDGLLFAVPVPYSSGYPDASVVKNIGALSNKGIEVSLSLGIVRSQDFGWDLTVNASTLKNEIQKLPDGQPEIINGTKKFTVGSSIYDFYLNQWYGVDPANGDGLFILKDALVGTTTTTNRELNGTWVTTTASNAKQDYVGTAIPDLFGSINNVFRYKNWSLQSLITYQIGGQIYDANYAQQMSGYAEGISLHKDILNAWQNPGDITDVPRLDSKMAAQYNQGSSRWLVDADYVSLRSANLTYTFKDTFTSALGFTSARLFVTGENLVNITKRKGLEPQENFSGTVTNRYTPARIFSIGANVSF
jgi:TonB-linked SusC/RagA family outer membrane protein